MNITWNFLSKNLNEFCKIVDMKKKGNNDAHIYVHSTFTNS